MTKARKVLIAIGALLAVAVLFVSGRSGAGDDVSGGRPGDGRVPPLPSGSLTTLTVPEGSGWSENAVVESTPDGGVHITDSAGGLVFDFTLRETTTTTP